jgi:hypothetical protein
VANGREGKQYRCSEILFVSVAPDLGGARRFASRVLHTQLLAHPVVEGVC